MPHPLLIVLAAATLWGAAGQATCDKIPLTDMCSSVLTTGTFCNADFQAVIDNNPGIYGARVFAACPLPLFCAKDFDCCDPQRCASRCAGTCVNPVGLWILLGIAGFVAVQFSYKSAVSLARVVLLRMQRPPHPL